MKWCMVVGSWAAVKKFESFYSLKHFSFGFTLGNKFWIEPFSQLWPRPKEKETKMN